MDDTKASIKALYYSSDETKGLLDNGYGLNVSKAESMEPVVNLCMYVYKDNALHAFFNSFANFMQSSDVDHYHYVSICRHDISFRPNRYLGLAFR